MSSLNRLWMAASVAVVNGHNEQGIKLKSGLKSAGNGRNKRFFSSGRSDGGNGQESPDFRPLYTSVEALRGGDDDEQRRQSEESVRQVIYLSCWG
ncbi:hypothetical protein M569_09740, partial [Genlisea aurea]